MNRIYLDHNATTPADPEVVRAMLPYFSEKYGNASSIHFFGQQARNAVEEVRDSVARLIGAQYEEIYFTGGGTESDNLAVKGVCQAAKGKGNHIITSGIEHSAVLNTCRFLEGKGFEVTYLPVDEYGRVNPDDVRKAVRKTTVLITVMHANNEVGTIQPVAELGKIAQERDIPFHTDAVQSFGKLSVNAEKMNADLISVSGHKIHGPKGIGCIYIRKGIRIEPLMHGGHHEREKRAGTENVPGIIGLGKAAGLAAAKREEESLRLTGLREKLWNGIREKIPHVLLNGHPEERLPTTLNVSFRYIEGESIILNLDMEGVAASTGSACTSGSVEPSHVLSAMGVSPSLAQSSVRFSLGRYNTEEEMDRVLALLPGIVEKLRKMSPLYKGNK